MTKSIDCFQAQQPARTGQLLSSQLRTGHRWLDRLQLINPQAGA
jgi:hypothetical protein